MFFTKNKIGCIIENGVYGIILGALLVGALLPEFGIKGIEPWIGGVAGAVLGVIYGAARGENE